MKTEQQAIEIMGDVPARTEAESDKQFAKSLVQRLNKAQHSPLPWNVGSEIGASLSPGFHIESPGIGYPAHVFGNSKDEALANAALIVRAVNHADKLAEALRQLLHDKAHGNGLQAQRDRTERAKQTLAAYESEVQP